MHQPGAYHLTDPVPDPSYRLPAITRAQVVIDGDRYVEVDPVSGEKLGEGRVERVREPIGGADA